MNATNSSKESPGTLASPGGTVNSANGHELRGVQLNGAASNKCAICGNATEERWFCKIPRTEGGSILLCCPSCTLRYLDSKRPATDGREEELRAGERNFRFFVGESKPWS